MKIESSALQMQSQHSASRAQTQSTKLEIWIGQRPTRSSQTQGMPQLRISDAARQAVAAEHAASEPVNPVDAQKRLDEHLTPQLLMLRDLIERMTGVVTRVSVALEQPAPATATAQTDPSNPPPAGQAARSAGFGMVLEHHEIREESEHTQFAAQGVVRTSDGQTLSFSLQLDMQRYHREESAFTLRLGDAAKPVDPLVVNFDGTAAELQDLCFAFDLNSDGQTQAVPLLSGNRGYLALDHNQNGRIDSGLELFGPSTGNGFSELARYDGDGNGWIDENDAVFNQLRVWTPSAYGTGPLRTLQETGVGALHLASVDSPFALRGEHNSALGAVRSTSVYLREDGGAGTVQQIDLMA